MNKKNEVTQREVYLAFLEKTGIADEAVTDYRPCDPVYGMPGIPNGMIIYLENGTKLIYIHQEENSDAE